MKITSTSILVALVTIFLAIVPNHLLSCYQGFRYPTRRMLQASGDIELPANTFTINNGVYEIWYEFIALSDSNSTNSTNSTTNSTTNGTEATNSTTNSTDTDATDDDNVTNSTDITNSTNATNNTNSTETDATDDDNVTNSTDATNSTTNSSSVDNNSTNSTDSGLSNSTNSTDTGNSTNSTDTGNSTNGTNSTATPTHVVFAIKFNNPGEFFALGFGSTSMAGADCWAFEFQDGAVVVSDRKALGFFVPPVDAQQDVELLGYEIADTYTLVKVRRAIDTGDSNDAVIQPGSNDLLWAFASTETISYHGNNRGTLTVELTQ